VACDCPDYEVPCKHIAGVCYRLAGQLDQDPYLLFEMRGLPPQQLLLELANSPLGKVLSDAKSGTTHELVPVASFYTRPILAALPQETTLKGFWQGQQPLPKSIESSQTAIIPALLIKKGGDFPAFWHKQNSFIEVMEDFYVRMRKATLKSL
jgi:uncharacterized Zn finger protein